MPDCLVERHGPVMLITFNRPERMNAMGGTLLPEFLAALTEARRDDRVRAVVVTGAGRAWCAGADLQAMGSSGAPEHERRFNAVDDIGEVGRIVLAIDSCDKPLIAAVNGVAVGGGFGLCSAFDLRIASEEARFGTIFIKRALAPDCGLSYYLPRLVGPERAAELFYSGRMVDAREALELGIVSRVVPHDQLLETALATAREYAAQPPAALTYTRRAIRRSLSSTLPDQLAFEWAQQKACLQGPEFREGVQAFLEKREPDYAKF
ncbi:enoyl-CoA hydratase/isomerase family protein [Tepidiforma sp.]|uniref:enoyl-CoA hydratase/isomerase family protein n=1 Tax=Tepidiforma sp. TaxID=2682230 RepID=UPI002ADE6393|nr:enoyl-CoA hydratase/isomerase family protein [Tepidiforma sp.]